MRLNTFSLLFDYQIIVSIIIVAVAWKWGDWKSWRLYYPTILFFIATSFITSFITYNYPLWEYESPLLKTTFSDVLITLVFFPATILLYIPYFPKKLLNRIFYILLWSIIYGITEMVSFRLGYFSYSNGWNIWWSLLFDLIMFSTLYLHHHRPLHSWLISFIAAVAIIMYFNIPFDSMK